MYIRQAESQDVPKLIQLIDQLGYKISSQDLANNLQFYGKAIFVAEREGVVIGCLAYHILPQFHSGKSHMRIVSIVVDEACRKMGVGTKMLKEAEKIAQEQGCEIIELTSAARRQGAHKLYESLGYVLNGEKCYFRKNVY